MRSYRRLIRQIVLDIPKRFDNIFSAPTNATEPLYTTRGNSAYFYDWSKLSADGKVTLWANPPFSQLQRVVTTIALEPCRIILVTPIWPETNWYRVLEKISLNQVEIPEKTKLYVGDLEHKPLPAPEWSTLVSLVDTTVVRIRESELDPEVIKYVKIKNQRWGREDLEEKVSRYPRLINSEKTLEKEIQTSKDDFSAIPSTPNL